MNKYQWKIKEQPLIKEADFPEVSSAALKLLFNRGLNTQQEIDEFLTPDYSRDIHNPFLFTQMQKAIDRLYQARESGETVLIYGDYDADGVCGSAILHKAFAKVGLKFQTYLPDREKEGYGLNQTAVAEFAKQGIKLIITVDCGISNTEEVALANNLGLEVIITDHHHVPEKEPEAYAIVHPGWDKNYPFKNLCGGGVAFKTAQALLRDPRSGLSPDEASTFEKWLLDLVAISTVADMVQVLGENRTLVKYGLVVLAKTKNLGLNCMFKAGMINPEKIDTFTIGFQIAPRLNAAGRMSHANNAYQLLTTENLEEALVIANQLNKSNVDRQNLTEKMATEAKKQIGAITEATPVVYAVSEGWNKGVVGLVASKLVQEYARPAFALSQDGDILVASGRSVPELNLIESLDTMSDLFLRYGGHSGAAGFSLKKEKFEEFKKRFSELAQEKLKNFKFEPVLLLDQKITLAQADWVLVETLENFKPFGEGNNRPKFLIDGLELLMAETIGQDGSHLRLMVKEGEVKRKIICFGFGEICRLLHPGDFIDVACEISINQWNGNKEIQLSLIDIKKHTS